ncbi:hypothetical protein [Chryseobacterium balustinum]|uniref:hypothetical protein n=1 Tax=Chryseobacterium balustinum TaxID=246 RepID=UPI003CEF4918
MKKLFTLALIGVFSTFLTSCSNTGTADLYPSQLTNIVHIVVEVQHKPCASTRRLVKTQRYYTSEDFVKFNTDKYLTSEFQCESLNF